MQKNSNSMTNLHLNSNSAAEKDLRTTNMFFVRKQTSPSPVRIKGLQAKYLAKEREKRHDTIEEEQPDMTNTLSDGELETIAAQQIPAQARTSPARNGSGLNKGSTTDRTYPQTAQINLVESIESTGALDTSMELQKTRRERVARSKSREGIEQSRPLSQQSVGRASQNTASGVRRTRKDRQQSAVGHAVKDLRCPITSEFKETNTNRKKSDQDLATGTKSTLFQNLINSRLESASGFAGRATPTPHLQVSELSSNINIPDMEYQIDQSKNQSFMDAEIRPRDQKHKVAQNIKNGGSQKRKAQANPYQYTPVKANDAETLKSKTSSRSQGGAKKTSSKKKKVDSKVIANVEEKAVQSYKQSDSNSIHANKSSNLGHEAPLIAFGDHPVPLTNSFSIQQTSNKKNGSFKKTTQTKAKSPLSHSKLVNRKKDNVEKQIHPSEREPSQDSKNVAEIENVSSAPETDMIPAHEAAAEREGNLEIPSAIFDRPATTKSNNNLNMPLQILSQKQPERKFKAHQRSQGSQGADPDKDIKLLRVQLTQALSQITLSLLREIDQIRKPQKYMFFASFLFKVLYELITQITLLSSKLSNRKRRREMVNNDFNQDLDVTGFSESNNDHGDSDSELDSQLVRRIKQKYFIQADMELKRLSVILPQDSKPLVQGVDKEILKEWTTTIKPFLAQNNIQFQSTVHAMSKNLKKLIEFNVDSFFDLQQIHGFASKMHDTLQFHQSFVNSCQKAGKSDSLFGKIIEIVNIASLYTIRKCEKEMNRSKPYALVTEEDFERDGSNLDNLEVQTGGNGPNETRQDESQRLNDLFTIGTEQQQIQRKNTMDNIKRQGSFNQSLQVQNRLSEPIYAGSPFANSYQFNKSNVFDYNVERTSSLTLPTIINQQIAFKINLRPVDVVSELSDFELGSSRKVLISTQRSLKEIGEEENFRTPILNNNNQKSPYKNIDDSQNEDELSKRASENNQGTTSAAEESIPHSSRLENSEQQHYNFARYDSSEVPTPQNESEQIVFEEEEKLTDGEFQYQRILKDCGNNEVNESSIFNINKAQYEDQLTTHSSITKGALNEQDVSEKDGNVTCEFGDKNPGRTNSIDISMDEEKATINLQEIKLGIAVLTFAQDNKVPDTDDEEAPLPIPASPQPTTPVAHHEKRHLIPNSQNQTPEKTKEESSDAAFSTSKIQQIIDELRNQMLEPKIIQPKVIYPIHIKQKSSANPYLSNHSGTSHQVIQLQQVEINAKPSNEIHQNIKNFQPEYGLYNPHRGILVHGIDHDFEEIDDGFRIIPMKVFARRPTGGSSDIKNRKSAGGSPHGGITSQNSRGSGVKSNQYNEKNTPGAIKPVVRQKYGSNTKRTGSGRSGQEKTENGKKQNQVSNNIKTEKTNKDKDDQPLSLDFKTTSGFDVLFSAATAPTIQNKKQDLLEQTMNSVEMQSSQYIQQTIASIGDTSNPYSRSKSRGESQERISTAAKEQIRKGIEQRKREKSN